MRQIFLGLLIAVGVQLGISSEVTAGTWIVMIYGREGKLSEEIHLSSSVGGKARVPLKGYKSCWAYNNALSGGSTLSLTCYDQNVTSPDSDKFSSANEVLALSWFLQGTKQKGTVGSFKSLELESNLLIVHSTDR